MRKRYDFSKNYVRGKYIYSLLACILTFSFMVFGCYWMTHDFGDDFLAVLKFVTGCFSAIAIAGFDSWVVIKYWKI